MFDRVIIRANALSEKRQDHTRSDSDLILENTLKYLPFFLFYS